MPLDLLPRMPDDQDQPFGLKAARGGEHVVEHGETAQLVQDLRLLRLHPGALACGEDDHCGRARHTHGLRLPRRRMDMTDQDNRQLPNAPKRYSRTQTATSPPW
ncbi:hypothetical protein GCM10010106_31430 [Thermopolyspora flexuosa]|nr:hypothetical protein GCM10010106_31430 [Thermopolyspora flexuosa]